MKTTLDIIKELPEYELLNDTGVLYFINLIDDAIKNVVKKDNDYFDSDLFTLSTKYHQSWHGSLIMGFYNGKQVMQEWFFDQFHESSMVIYSYNNGAASCDNCTGMGLTSVYDKCDELELDFNTPVEDNRWIYDAYYGSMNKETTEIFNFLHSEIGNFKKLGNLIKYYRGVK